MANNMTGFEYKHLETVEERYWHAVEFLKKHSDCNFYLKYKRQYRIADGFGAVWNFGKTVGTISLDKVLQMIMTADHKNCVIIRSIFTKKPKKIIIPAGEDIITVTRCWLSRGIGLFKMNKAYQFTGLIDYVAKGGFYR